MAVRLEFGSGLEGLPGYYHIDIIKCDGVDKKLDVSKELPFKDNSVDEILARHLIEHIDYWKYPGVFEEWYRIMKPEGKLSLVTPDFEWMAKSYVKSRGKDTILWYNTGRNFNLNFMIFGGHGDKGDDRSAFRHKGLFGFEYLKMLLEMAKFRNVARIEKSEQPYNIFCEAIK